MLYNTVRCHVQCCPGCTVQSMRALRGRAPIESKQLQHSTAKDGSTGTVQYSTVQYSIQYSTVLYSTYTVQSNSTTVQYSSAVQYSTTVFVQPRTVQYSAVLL